MIILRTAALAIALVLPSAASAQDTPSDNRPHCIDWAAVGNLKPLGYRPADIPDDVLGHGFFDYRMTVTRPIWRASADDSLDIHIFGHAERIIYPGSIVFRGKSADGEWVFVGLERILKRRDGKWFIPTPHPRNPDGGRYDWRPSGFEHFLRPVRVVEEGHGWTYEPEEAEPGYSEVRDGRRITLKGLFLEDLPKLLESIPSSACRR